MDSETTKDTKSTKEDSMGVSYGMGGFVSGYAGEGAPPLAEGIVEGYAAGDLSVRVDRGMPRSPTVIEDALFTIQAEAEKRQISIGRLLETDLAARVSLIDILKGKDDSPPIINDQSSIINAEAQLHAMLRAEPVLSAQLYETLKYGRWLITMHRKVKDSPPDDLESDSTMHGFPAGEIVTVMQNHCRRMLADHNRNRKALELQAADVRRWK